MAVSRELLQNIRRIQIKTDKMVNDVLAGAYHSAFKGRGIEFEDVREYIPGDEIRSIDWNVTARMNYPFVKNFREERELTVMLIVDISASTRFGSALKHKNDILAEIGAVLAFSAIKNNDKVGLLLFSEGIEKYLPPNKGLKHGLRVVRELLACESHGSTTNIIEPLNFIGKVQKRRGVCFLLSDLLMSLPSSELACFAKRHELISICITDPRESFLPDVGLVNLCDLETGEEIVVDTSIPEVREFLAENTNKRLINNKNLMHKVGAGFIHIDTDKSYVEPIRKYFRLKEARR